MRYRVDTFTLGKIGFLDHEKIEFDTLDKARAYADSMKTKCKSIFILKKNIIDSYDVLEQFK